MTKDSQCASGLCEATTVNGKSTCAAGACTGTGSNLNADNCVKTTTHIAATPSESCSVGTQSGSYCYCTNDNQCTSGVCVTWAGCSGTNCSAPSGTAMDSSHCATSAPTCQSNGSICPLAGSTTCSGGNCKCGADSDCPGSKCVCAGAGCTGAGPADNLGCVIPTPALPAITPMGQPSCPAGGTCNTGTSQCLCTNDNQCPTGACVSTNPGCTGTNCTGTGTGDAHGCATATPACSQKNTCSMGGATTCTAASTPECHCGADTDCPGSKCVCAGAGCTGSGTTDDLGCVLPAALTYTAAPPPTCGTGTCNTGTTQCWCTSDSQCSTGACVNQGQAGCTAGTCTGTGSPDAHSCAPTTPTCSGTTNYACPSSTSGTCNASNSCLCNSDSQCGAGGQCVNSGQAGCTAGTCTGTGSPNARGCQKPALTLPVGCTKTIPYSCPSGVCNAAGTACLCTDDNQCPSGQCVNGGQAGCTAGTCTGTGTGDAANCVPSGVVNCSSPPPPAGNNAQCGGVNSVELCSTGGDGGGPGLGQCSKACTTNANCGGGETCVAGFCTGCNTSTNCYDRKYAKTCTGAAGALNGQCCGNGTNLPSSSCGTNSGLFPEACLQTPLSDQEKALEFMFFDLTSCVTPDTAPAVQSVLLTPKTFSLDFVATCPSGTIPRWREFDYQASFPTAAAGPYSFPYPADSIDFAAQTGSAAADGGAFLPATPLQLGAPATTTTTLPAYVQILLDTAPKGSGILTTATPPLASKADLRMWITLTPTADELSSPTLLNWKAQYDCPASE